VANDTRKSMSLEYLIQKRQSLLDELHSDEHYESTPTIAYGHHDPLNVPEASCEICGNLPVMKKVDNPPLRWAMFCECGRRAKTDRKRPWQAALEWNWINLGSYDYQALPLFGLSNLEPDAARQRMAGIRRNLEVRKGLAGVETTIARKTNRSMGIEQPGKGYVERLDAYLMWAMWALRLIKIAAAREATRAT